MARSIILGASIFASMEGLVAAQQTSLCSWSSGNGTSFDLSAARLGGSLAYTVQDVRQMSTNYTFNVCGNAPPPSKACSAQACGNTFVCPPRPENNNPAAGWQQQDNGAECYRLGSSNGQNWSYNLQDIDYPNKGVTILYTGGDGVFCNNNQPRSLALQFLCHAPSGLPKQVFKTTVIGRNDCNYGIGIPSIIGCPSECRTGVTSLCNGHGVCGFNTDAKRSQCYCYNGFQGASCGAAAPAPPTITTEGIMLIIILIALTTVIGLVVFMFMKLRKLTVDPGAYDQLQGRFNELGMLA